MEKEYSPEIVSLSTTAINEAMKHSRHIIDTQISYLKELIKERKDREKLSEDYSLKKIHLTNIRDINCDDTLSLAERDNLKSKEYLRFKLEVNKLKVCFRNRSRWLEGFSIWMFFPLRKLWYCTHTDSNC